MSARTKKAAAAAAATVLSSLLLLGGTLAWQSISQQALNEASKEVNPGGRLHDDFNGADKRIYVENFGDEPIYARIRLLEYLEVGDAAGKNLNDTSRYDPLGNVSITSGAGIEPVTAKVLTPTAESYDKTTWLPHNFDPQMVNPADSFFEWQTGGETYYLPTFNMNKDSLQPDVNGTLQGLNGLYPWEEPEGTDDRYTDYIDYAGYINYSTRTDAIQGYEIKDADSNTVDELFDRNIDVYQYVAGDPSTALAEFINNKNIRVNGKVEHTVKSTRRASLISISEWLALYEKALEQYGGQTLPAQSSLSDYWVYDADGWCYYSKPIDPGAATGLLLSGLERKDAAISQNNCYYAIHVDAQFITGNDLGKADSTGFYTDGEPSHNALTMLGIIGVDVS